MGTDISKAEEMLSKYMKNTVSVTEEQTVSLGRPVVTKEATRTAEPQALARHGASSSSDTALRVTTLSPTAWMGTAIHQLMKSVAHTPYACCRVTALTGHGEERKEDLGSG